MTYKAIFFDLDGVIFDSYDLWDQAVSQLLADYGVSYSEEIKQTLWQLPMTEANGYLLGLIDEFVDEGGFEKQKRSYLKKRYQTVPLIKGAQTVLAELNQQGFQLYAVTANYADLARAGLEAHELLANFVTVYSSLESESGDKDFEFYRQVLDHEKLGAQDVLMVEDSLPNLQIAQKLGIQGLYFENDIFPRNNKAFPFISIESLLQLRQYLEVKND